MKQLIIIAFIMAATCTWGWAQPVTYQLVFSPVFGNERLVTGEIQYALDNDDSVGIEDLKFYISAIELRSNGTTVWKESNSFHLLDVAVPASLNITLHVPDEIHFTEVAFNLGVDSTASTSGAMDGDLDPVKGMYWAWQSGYINFRLEGKTRLSKGRNNSFQYHLGGYSYPFNALQKLVLPVNHGKAEIKMDIKAFLNDIDIVEIPHVMSPCKDAVLLSQKAAAIFSSQ